MTTALSLLSAGITATLKRHAGTETTHFTEFPKLKAAEQYLAKTMAESEKTLIPSFEKRLKAIEALRQLKVLGRHEWKLIFAGLSDKDPDSNFPVLLEDDSLYSRVEEEIKKRINKKTLQRREWKFLCSSYFGYHAKKPEENNNWCSLREYLRIGYGVIKSKVRNEKSWMRILDQYRDLFTPSAGDLLAEKMTSGEIIDFSVLETIAQIPDDSWLWYRAFVVLLAKIQQLDEDEFRQRIPHLLTLAEERERYRDIILRACLTKYHLSNFREIPHPQLKQMALDNWGSPQLRSKENVWLHHLKDQNTCEKICGMVRSWLARYDLENFFHLLKGSEDVDQARLFYWLRFAPQMSFTRIVMGYDARHDMRSDFDDFRKKNKGRLSNLSGGTSADNAVIMQIGDYFFVEFSRKGNALYVYKATSAPFNPEARELHLNDVLKSGNLKYRHAPTAVNYSDKYLTGWMLTYEEALRSLGIKLHSSEIGGAKIYEQSSLTTEIQSHQSFEDNIKNLLKELPCTVSDKRKLGGALQVRLSKRDPSDVAKLLRLGFKPKHGDPLMFWRN